jgi:hypothetical protein
MKMVLRLLEPLNWRNALGHVLVTALGVVLALAAADWSEQRKRRAFELTLLQEMHTALASDLTATEQLLQRFQDIGGGLVQLLAVLEEKRPYDPAAMDGLFGKLFGFRTAALNDGAYESLLSMGIDLVSDPALRTAIADVYEVQYRRLEDIGATEEKVHWEVVRPYYTIHFRDVRGGQNATPLDYQQVINDPEYRNIVEYKLLAMQGAWAPTIESAIAELGALVAMLEAELKEAGVPLQQ